MSGRDKLSVPTVSLDAATRADATLLANLLELYTHDLSSVFPEVLLGPDGRFGYPKLSLYWAEAERRFAFIVRADGYVAGFILATRGSPAVDDPEALDVAEFFVLRRYRRAGVGSRAAALLWRRLPGRWVVRVSEANRNGLAFWTHVVEAASGGRAVTFAQSGSPAAWRVFTFTPALEPDAG
jgi:predicted acetyltransferase